MTRPIKFRAWDKKHRKFVLPETDDYGADIAVAFSGNVLTKQDNGACGDPECCGDYEEYMAPGNQGNFTLMQFTGLLDKNGKEIYEGDIVGIDRGYGPVTYAVVWYRKGWGLQINDNYSFDEGIRAWAKSEVIGNIYENPELLKS